MQIMMALESDELLLGELLKFNDEQGYPQTLSSGNRTEQYVLRIPTFKQAEMQRFHRNNQNTKFFDYFLAGLLQSRDKQAALDMLIQYLAKHHSENFMKQVEFATKLFEKNQPKKPWVCPENVVMYDGGSRENPDHVKWNLHYQELLEYKQKHGDCRVPARRQECSKGR